MSDLRAPLLRPRSGMHEASPPPPARPLFSSGVDTNKRGCGIRNWIRIDKSGNSQVLEVDKMTIMRRCQLPPRDLRLLDPLFVYPSTILGREKAIVVNLEQIRCVITADEVLILNSLDSHVLQYVTELQRRLSVKNEGHTLKRRSSFDSHAGDVNPRATSVMFGLQHMQVFHQGDIASAECLPFEFRGLEVALEAVCTYLDSQATNLELEAYPVLDDLTSKINTLTLERVRRLKSKLATLTSRVQKVRDEIEHLMDDDGDMAEMYLTQKKERIEFSFYQENYMPLGVETSLSAPVSPVYSPTTEPQALEKTVSTAFTHIRSQHGSTHSSENGSENIEQLEMLLEAYFVVVDSTLNKLTSLKEYIDDTEDFVNIQLDNVRNQLIQFELILTTATFVVAIYGVVAGVFGMNIEIGLFEEPKAFKWVIVIAGLCGLVIFFTFLAFFRCKGLMPLS